MWGNQATAEYEPTWNTYKNHTKNRKTAGRRELPAPDDPENRADRAVPVGQNIGKTAVRSKIARLFASAGQGGGERLPAIQCPALQAPFYRWARSFPGRGESGSIRGSLDGAAVVCGYNLTA